MNAMRNETTPEQRIQTATRLALVFAQLGSIDNAAQILNQAERVAADYSGTHVKETLSQIAIQAEIARFMRRAAFEQTSKNLFTRLEQRIATLPVPSQQDLAFRRLIEHSSRALDLAQAETYISQVKDPEVQAKAREDLQRVGVVMRSI
jgi:hypothetical protein